MARVAAIAYREAAPAAFLMSCSTSSGWETMATWLVAISTLVAPTRGANCRWASGGIAWSPSAMRNQVGSDFQAGAPINSPSALQCNGCWTANMTLAFDRIDVGSEVLHEVVLGQPGETVLIDVAVRQGGTGRCLFQKGADRFALGQRERGDDVAAALGRVAVGQPSNGNNLATPRPGSSSSCSVFQASPCSSR